MIRRVATLLFVSAIALRAQGPARDVAPIKTGAKVDVAIGTGVIRGRVLAAATGEPLRKARVSISSDAGEHDPVFSDNDGRFELTGLQAGRHTLSAAKAGYVTTKFGARRLIDRATPVEVADGSVIEHIEIRLPRGAAINGHVVDDLGDPLVDQSVTAGRVVHTGGRATFVQSGSAGRTDDLGEYRISGLPAGTYVVSVSSTPGPMANDFRVIITSDFRVAGGTVLAGGSDSLRNTGWARTYYPGATSLSAAQPITVRVGEEAEAIDFAVTATRTPRLSITVTDAYGDPANGFFTITPNSMLDTSRRPGMFQDGSASMDLEPGDWVIEARGLGGPGRPAGMAIAAFSVGGEDLSVNLVLTKGATMTGRAIFEGLASPPDKQILALEAIPFGIVAAASVVTNPPAGITRDGTFVMTDLVGLREFRVRSIPPGWTLKSLTLDGRSLLDGPIEFKGSEQLTGVVAVLTNRHSELTGTVVDAEKKPVRDYSLVVFPEDRLRLRNPGRWTRWTRPDQNGRFSIDDLPAGKYLAIALDDVDEAEWSTVEYLDRLRPRATPVTIVDGQKQTTTLELVGTP